MPARRRLPRSGALTDLPPSKIVRKIALLQLAFYVCATSLILFTTLVSGTAFSLDIIFSWNSLRGDTTVGWMLGLVWLLNSFFCVIFLVLVVSRSKLIPDFALTIHFLHLVIVSAYSHSLPTNWLWWALQIASSAIMTFLGIWLCQRLELQPISFGALSIAGNVASAATSSPSGASAQNQTGIANNNNHSESEDHLFPGISRGRGRGRARDSGGGGGEYEMVSMKELEEGTL